MNPFPSEGLPLPSSFCTPPGDCSPRAGEAAAAPARPKPGKSATNFAAKPRRVVRLENMCDPPLKYDSARFDFLGQGKTKDITSCGDGNVLLAVHRVTHGRSVKRLAGAEMPQGLAGFCFDRFEGFRVVAKEHETACGCHGSGGGPTAVRLRIAPANCCGIEVESQKSFLTALTERMAGAGAVIRFTFFEILRAGEENGAFFLRDEK